MPDLTVLREFSNVGWHSPNRNFIGFSDTTQSRTWMLPGRDAQRISVRSGDLVMIEGADASVAVLARDNKGEDALSHFGLQSNAHLATNDFDEAALSGWLTANGALATDSYSVYRADFGPADEPLIFRASSAAHVWVIVPLSVQDTVSGATVRPITVTLKPAVRDGIQLPDPIGTVFEEFTVDRGSARAYELRKGQYAQIIDVQGQQCSDFQAAATAGLDRGDERFIDSTATRSMVRRPYPGPGLFDKFFDADLQPMMRVIQDTCGRHDTFGVACTARGYEDRGFPGHLNCSDNMSDALDPFGVKRRSAWPAINFFWNTWVSEADGIQTEESHSRPGDYVVLEALDDLVCVSTACPDDIDPINGWNPTDIHVRIYEPEQRIQRSVGYRKREDAEMKVSQETPFFPRLEKLTNHFQPARDQWSAVEFPSVGVLGEYWACREAVTVQDMSGLRKVDIAGPDAGRLLQLAMTRDIARLAQWRGTYALMCDETGAVIDDGTLFALGDGLYRWCCGSEESGRWLTALAAKHALQVRVNDLGNTLPNLSIQGPKSRDLLRDVVYTQPHVPSLDQLKWFGATVARLGDRDGAPFMLTRTGYTGELGYEVFCGTPDALRIWDAIFEAGASYGLKPMGTTALNLLRVEAGLAAANAEFAPGVDAIEAGLGFAVNFKKDAFVGRAALERNAASPRNVLVGLEIGNDDVPRHGAPILKDERQIGVVTSAIRSPMRECGIAMARVAVEFAETGNTLDIGLMDGRMKRVAAQVVPVPFVDPKRERARA